MYGLPADTVRHKYTKKAAAPHPFWNEEPFTFKRVRERGREGGGEEGRRGGGEEGREGGREGGGEEGRRGGGEGGREVG